MGSGSSKETGNTRPGGPKPVTVANVNNNTSQHGGTVDSKSLTRNEPDTNRTTPVSKTPTKEPSRWNSNEKKSPKKSAKNSSKDDAKFTGKMTWDDSDIEDDDWDDFLGKPSSKPVPKQETRVIHNPDARDLNPDTRPEPTEHYPETYAQRLNRQQYTFGQDRLIREKTIYRNPEEWGDDGEDEDEPTSSEVTKGFDASRFRAANHGQSTRDKDLFSPREDDIEVPKVTKKNDFHESEQEQPKPRPKSQKVPVYTKEEEDLMAELMTGDNDDFFIGHQAVNPY